jgi:hypothetical protein
VFSGADGWKPRTLLAAGKDLYLATEKGGGADLGVFGVRRDGQPYQTLVEFASGDWKPVPQQPSLHDGRYEVEIDSAQGSQFYRLRH